MNKRAALIICLLGTSVLSGCSGINVFDGRSIWGKGSKEVVSTPVENSVEASKVDSDDSDDSMEPMESVSLVDEQIESFPAWFALESFEKNRWTEVPLNSKTPLSHSLKEHGLDSNWLNDLRRSDYIQLSTFSDQQVMWVETSLGGDFKSAYLPVNAHKAYYIEQTESGPLMSTGGASFATAGSFELGPDTKISDLSDVQRSAVSGFLSEVLPKINHEAEVLLAKGETHVFFQYVFLQKKRIGKIHVTKVRSKYKDLVMTYRPE